MNNDTPTHVRRTIAIDARYCDHAYARNDAGEPLFTYGGLPTDGLSPHTPITFQATSYPGDQVTVELQPDGTWAHVR